MQLYSSYLFHQTQSVNFKTKPNPYAKNNNLANVGKICWSHPSYLTLRLGCTTDAVNICGTTHAVNLCGTTDAVNLCGTTDVVNL